MTDLIYRITLEVHVTKLLPADQQESMLNAIVRAVNSSFEKSPYGANVSAEDIGITTA